MNVWDAVGLVGGLASIAGLSYAIYYARQSRKVKQLVFDTSPSIPLATAVSPENDYTLSIILQRPGLPEERIKSAHVRFLRFANLGKEPIRREDIAPANPLAIIVEGVRTLDISVAGVTRPVNKLTISELSVSADTSRAEIVFDFLDYQDGSIVKVLTEGGAGTMRLVGDIIGMPGGITPTVEAGPFRVLNAIGFLLGLVMKLAAYALTFYTFYWVTGSWKGVWLLFLPFLAWFLPGVIFLIFASTILPARKPRFPSSLGVPDWFRRLAQSHTVRDVSAVYLMSNKSEILNDGS